MKRIICLMLVVLSMFTLLAACGGGKGGNASEAGTYNLVSMTMGDTTVDLEALTAMGMPAGGIYVKLNGDGTGEMNVGTETMEICYENGKLWPVDEPDEPVSYTISGKTLTMSEDGTTMVFEK